MNALIKYRRITLLLPIVVVGLVAAWIYWNQPHRVDLATFAPSDCLAFVETDSASELLLGVEESHGWRTLAGPIGARSNLLANRWLVRVARWFGIGNADALLLARSQFGIVFTGAEMAETGPTLTIRPLATLIIETHSSPRRVRPALEGHIEEFARRIYGQPQFTRKQIDGADIAEWSSSDGMRHIVLGFLESAAIIGNDETSVVSCLETKRGKRAALAGDKSFGDFRSRINVPDSSLFGFVSNSGVKSILQAYALYKAPSADAVNASRLLSDTAGNLINGLGCRSQFVEGMVEDRCFLALTEGVADKLRPTMVAQDRLEIGALPFVPRDAYSVSIYHLRDVDGFWNDMNAVVSSHTDVIGALAARPLLRSLLKPYGIDDPDGFVHAIGARIETIRLEENSPSVLVTEALDRQSLRKLAAQRLGAEPRAETVGESELLLSNSDNWGASFAENHLLIGPAESVRRCLQVQSQSITSIEGFRRSERLVDVSLPLTAITFKSDRQTAISFVELFSEHERPSFSTNANAVDQAAHSLPYAVNVTMLKDNGFEWTSRSAFGLPGSLVIALAPER
jgi:hypothetical protein